MTESPPKTDFHLVEGVFAFLNSALSSNEIAEATICDPEPEFNWFRCKPRARIARLINETFRLQWACCPLRKKLAEYRLYYRNDMADALAKAFLIKLRGEDPEEALAADYAVSGFGILKWVDLAEFREGCRNGDHHASFVWPRMERFFEKGDRLVRYGHQTSSGFLLVRGDRLVWPEEVYHYCELGGRLRRKVEEEEYQRRGGSKGYLAGKFTWPDPEWENPVTPEQEHAYAEERRNRFK